VARQFIGRTKIIKEKRLVNAMSETPIAVLTERVMAHVFVETTTRRKKYSMETTDRVKKLTKAVDDMYANIYLWHQLDQGRQNKLKELFKRMKSQLGISEEPTRGISMSNSFLKTYGKPPAKKGCEDF
jgi:hypothetical protein